MGNCAFCSKPATVLVKDIIKPSFTDIDLLQSKHICDWCSKILQDARYLQIVCAVSKLKLKAGKPFKGLEPALRFINVKNGTRIISQWTKRSRKQAVRFVKELGDYAKKSIKDPDIWYIVVMPASPTQKKYHILRQLPHHISEFPVGVPQQLLASVSRLGNKKMKVEEEMRKKK